MAEEMPEPEEMSEKEYRELLEKIQPERKPKLLRDLQPKSASPLPGTTPPLPLPGILAREINRIPVGRRPGHLFSESKATTEVEEAVAAAGEDARIPITCPECGTTFRASGPFPKSVTCPECGWTGEVKV